MKYLFNCETEDGKPAHVLVTDLNEFVQAGPESDVFVHDVDGSQSVVKKGSLTFLSVSLG
jgi:hypothetical protein